MVSLSAFNSGACHHRMANLQPIARFLLCNKSADDVWHLAHALGYPHHTFKFFLKIHQQSQAMARFGSAWADGFRHGFAANGYHQPDTLSFNRHLGTHSSVKNYRLSTVFLTQYAYNRNVINAYLKGKHLWEQPLLAFLAY